MNPTMNPFYSPSRRHETPKEKNFNKPTPFHGDRAKIETFIQECRMYLHANRTIYTEDEDKIMFMLSYMTDKEALRWKQTILRSLTNAYGEMEFPTFREFVGELEGYFRPANTRQDAAHKLSLLRQGKMTAEEVITEFRLLTSQAGYAAETPSDHMHLIEKLRKTLNPALAKKIMLDYQPPTTIMGWVERAILLDTQYRQTMEIMNEGKNDGKGKGDKDKKGNKSGWSNYFNKDKKEKDPDAMDIDRLTPEKRSFLMKKGACFKCEKPGHLAKEHDEYEKKEKEKKKASTRRTEATTSTSSTTPSKPTSSKKDMKKLHALLQALSTEEKEELFALQSPEKEKEEKEEDNDSESDF
jgi:Ty3 transposon capsid-like protein